MTISSRTSQGAATTVARFAVADMECAGCVAKVEEAIAKVDGISAVTTSLVARRVAVQQLPAIAAAAVERPAAIIQGFLSRQGLEGGNVDLAVPTSDDGGAMAPERSGAIVGRFIGINLFFDFDYR